MAHQSIYPTQIARRLSNKNFKKLTATDVQGKNISNFFFFNVIKTKRIAAGRKSLQFRLPIICNFSFTKNITTASLIDNEPNQKTQYICLLSKNHFYSTTATQMSFLFYQNSLVISTAKVCQMTITPTSSSCIYSFLFSCCDVIFIDKLHWMEYCELTMQLHNAHF